MIDHISVSVSDPAASKAFYEAALAPLGYRVVMDFGPVTALGGPMPGAPEDAPVPPDLWLTPTKDPTPCHIAVSASSAEQVIVCLLLLGGLVLLMLSDAASRSQVVSVAVVFGLAVFMSFVAKRFHPSARSIEA